MQKISSSLPHALYSVAQTRQIENLAAHRLPANTLMQRAGLATARLALAVAPHAERIWIACGPGNNGGDGLETALHLQRLGKQPIVSWLGQPGQAPADALMAYQRFIQQGIPLQEQPPDNVELCIDALIGIGGQRREPAGRMAAYISHINASNATVLSIDVPSGLDADTGQASALQVYANHTLSLLTLKPGLYTAHGRDVASTVWFDALGISPVEHGISVPSARLLGKPKSTLRPHASHKGSYGDVAVIGGATGMVGAALLAARAALHAGAGRVFVGLLDGGSLTVDPYQPEIMFRAVASLGLSRMTTVFGCGGGDISADLLRHILLSEGPVVVDADAINAVAEDAKTQAMLVRRGTRGAQTVLTPHPLEAARLLGCTTAQIQSNRLDAAKTLSQRYACTVALKGSGTLIASPNQIGAINPTGSAALATAGTGDVLAGMIGAQLAQGLDPFEATCHAVYRHGEIADTWHPNLPLTASTLARSEH